MSAPHEPMSPSDVARHRTAKEQAKAVLACGRSSKVRRSTLLLSVHGDANHALVAEVIATAYGPVVVTYRAKGNVRAVAPLTSDPAQDFPADGYHPLTAKLLNTRITNGAKQLTLLRCIPENNERLVLGYGPDASPEAAAKAQVSRLRAAVRYRREHAQSAAEIAGTEKYLAAAEAELAEIRRQHTQRMSR